MSRTSTSTVAGWFAEDLLRDQRNVALKLIQSLIEKDKSNKVKETGAAIKPTDFLELENFYETRWNDLCRSIVMHTREKDGIAKANV